MRTLKTIGWLLGIFLSITLKAQPVFQQVDHLQVFKGDRKLAYPWAGGLNSAQFCDPDLNGDGIRDLLVFEKTENRVLTYITTAPGQYEINRDYIRHIPAVEGWVITKDMNCDGIDDLLTYSNASIKVYRGIRVNDTLQFELWSDGIYYPGFSGRINLYSSFVDRPAVADFDGDGDMDILTFNVTANRMTYYKNVRVEESLSCDTLAYKLYDNCWGNVFESGLDPVIEMRDTCSDKYMSGRIGESTEDNVRRHAGSTLEAYDINGNGVLDVLMGDVSLSLLNYMRNEGTKEDASVLAQDTAFPSYNVPVKIYSFPWSIFLDVNHDGKKDLIVTAFEGLGVDNYDNVWYYENSGTDSVRLSLVSRSFMVGDMLDAGENAVPALLDVDGDGLTDLIIGGGYRKGGNISYRLHYYKNIGFKDYPAFRLADEDYLGFSNLGLGEPHPTGGDLDGDGKKDLLVGLSDGRILFYRNQSTGNDFSPASPTLLKLDGNDLDVGQYAAPYVADIDRDGRIELIVGENNGNINLFRNTASSGNITLVQLTDSLGKITTASQFIPFGNSAVSVGDYNGDGKNDMIVGGYENVLWWVSNIEDSLFQKVSPVPVFEESGRIGRKMAPVVTDLTDNGDLCMLIGLQTGGILFFSENPPDIRPVSVVTHAYQAPRFYLYPNPAQSAVTLKLEKYDPGQWITWQLFDAMGRILRTGQITGIQQQIMIGNVPSGMYFFSIRDEKGAAGVRSLVIQQ